jgi:DNA-binding winged helix-turn-helix (wHTH) protein/energy-coupling factor transporter ATP-binding protein EcfA2
MVTQENNIHEFGCLQVVVNQRRILLNGKAVEHQQLHFNFLLYLIKNRDRVVEKQELLDSVWTDSYVEESALPRVVTQLRKILGGRGSITTKHKFGYQFNPDFFINADKIPCPWMGLRQYTKEQEKYFCGRKADIDKVVEKLKTNIRLFSLVGPSGVGKSSLVRAGIIPKLKRGELAGSDSWTYLSVRPAHHPLWELSQCIASLKYPALEVKQDDVGEILNNLRQNPSSIIQELEALENPKIFLFIDQIEELLSKDTDKIEAALFVQSILELVKNTDITQACIINLRRSFYPQFLAVFTELGSLLTENTLHINEMTTAQLMEVIDSPAIKVGLKLEDGLSALIIKDINASTNILPLLSNFLVELFQCRDGDKIAIKHYDEIGGIENSISF